MSLEFGMKYETFMQVFSHQKNVFLLVNKQSIKKLNLRKGLQLQENCFDT